jgi:hypothetical protein
MIFKLETKKDRVEAQLKLRDLGFYLGPIDGLWGLKSEKAYEDYLNSIEPSLAVVPKGAIPWWKTRRARGALVLIAGLAAMFIPGMDTADTTEIVDIVFTNMDSIQIVIEQVGKLIAAVGAIWSIIGARGATAPIDSNLIAKIGEKEIRFSKKTYSSADEVPTGTFVDRARGWFGET